MTQKGQAYVPPDYEKTYWALLKLRESLEMGEIKLPYARGETIDEITKLLAKCANVAFKEAS